MSELGKEAAVQSALSTPPVVISAATFFYGLTLQDWVAFATLIYVVLQIFLLLPKLLREFKSWRKGV